MTPSPFLPMLEPPDDLEDSALWFWVADGGVVVRDDRPPEGLVHFLGLLDGRHCWAAEVAPDHLDEAPTPLFGLYGQLGEERWAVAGRAVQLVEWARTHRYCGRCATPTEPVAGERAMRCPACGLLAFPRLAPAIIVLIERDGGEALLARGRQFPIPMYSCLAGFVEPGETLEQAVHREVREEVGVEVGDLTYAASQPWPFPHSLMIGFRARWTGGDIVLDEREIVDAGWYRCDALPAIPPPMSIARRLIDDWVGRAHG